MATKTVSATDAKNRLGALLADLSNGADAIVIEHHGRPRAVVITLEEWTALGVARDELRRREAWERLEQIAEEFRARNPDLTQEEADAIADELADEAKRRLALRFGARAAPEGSGFARLSMRICSSARCCLPTPRDRRRRQF